jgi:tRNA (guanine26-N2/guanine27-N2)-dimethyltransferase
LAGSPVGSPAAFPYPVREVREGAARLLVPDVPRRKGPGARGPWPFYNPTMAVNRDLSALVLRSWPNPLLTVLDGLTATGAWGIRMAVEADVKGLVLNDWSRRATDLAGENARRNGIDARVVTEPLSRLLGSIEADFVDIDPFGPPAPFLEAALAAARPGSGLGVTATDTAVLGGTYPETCVRRYGARPMRCDQGNEIGVRILLGYCSRLASKLRRAIEPVLSVAAAHFYRTMIRVRRLGPSPPVGWVVRGSVVRGSAGRFDAGPSSADRAIGPHWVGSLQDPGLVSRLSPSPWTGPEGIRLLFAIQGEADLPAFFVTTDELAALCHGSSPTLDRILEGLRDIGFRAARTHFHPRGVRTDAPHTDVVRAFRATMPNGPRDGSGPAS